MTESLDDLTVLKSISSCVIKIDTNIPMSVPRKVMELLEVRLGTAAAGIITNPAVLRCVIV